LFPAGGGRIANLLVTLLFRLTGSVCRAQLTCPDAQFCAKEALSEHALTMACAVSLKPFNRRFDGA
jgi:hypothetical protein